MESIPSDGTGWATETKASEESVSRTGNVVVVHRAPYLRRVPEDGSCEVGVKKAEVEEEGKEHLVDVHDGWRMWAERGQEVDSARRGFDIK